jgi:bifunctional oligoribonuclease and PAP phosphatase NrnA
MSGAPTRGAVTALQVAEHLRTGRRVLAVSHESPDGDAIGCLSAFLLLCEQLGVPCTAYIPGEAAFPPEYSFLPRVSQIARGELPVVEPGSSVYFFDCASLLRCDAVPYPADVTRVNIDHHQDNPGYADLNLLDASAPSSTAIVYEVCKAGGFAVDTGMATALYVGLVTDTGRFQYSNTTPVAHRMAAELQERGLDVNDVYRRVYESTPLPKLRLLETALCHLEVRLQGSLVTSWLGNDDFVRAGAEEGHAEGIIDELRRIRGAKVAAVARTRSRNGLPETKVSLRSTDGAVDVAALAALKGGGGHTRAAGFTTQEDLALVLEWIERQVEARL